MMTARIRSVKPELFSHEGLFEIEMKYQLPIRLAYIALFTCCDRRGRFRWQPRRLKLDMMPYDDVDIGQILELFREHGYIQKYEDISRGEIYGWIPSWENHQIINGREHESELPSIEEVIYRNNKYLNQNKELLLERGTVIDGCFTRAPHVDDASTTQTQHGSGEGKGRERKGREGKRDHIVESSIRQRDEEPIQKIFEYWKKIMGHPTSKLDGKRKSIIRKALKFGYSEIELCEAIQGCSLTPHNIGDNDRGQRYDGLNLILRDADQIDRFIHNAQNPPKRLSDADRRSQANVQTLQDWMQKTIAAEEAVHGSA